MQESGTIIKSEKKFAWISVHVYNSKIYIVIFLPEMNNFFIYTYCYHY